MGCMVGMQEGKSLRTNQGSTLGPRFTSASRISLEYGGLGLGLGDFDVSRMKKLLEGTL